MSSLLLTEDEATIEIRGGMLGIGLRLYDYSGSGRYTFRDEIVWLGFDEDDPERSATALRGERQLSFQVRSTLTNRQDLIVYLGDPDPRSLWDDDLAVRLRYQFSVDGWGHWWVGSENDNDRVRTLRREYWRAADATIKLYQERDGERVLLRRPNDDFVATTIRLDYKESHRNLYEGVLEDMRRLTMQGDLASSFRRYVDFQDIQDRREETPGLELFKRLQGVFPRYRATAAHILRRPDAGLEMSIQHYAMSTDEAVSHFASRGRSEAVERVYEVQSVQAQAVPTCFTARRAVEVVDTPANRFVAASLARVRQGIILTKRHLEEEQDALPEPTKYDQQAHAVYADHHERAVKDVEGLIEEIDFLISRQPWPAARPGERANLPSSATYYDGRYTRLRELTSLMEMLLQFVDASEEAIPFEVQAFHKLYQHWCFVHIVEAMTKLGFRFVDEEGRRTTPFYKNPVPNDVNCRFIHPLRGGYIIEVFYERRYERARELQRSFRRGGRPPLDQMERPYGLENRSRPYTRYRGGKNNPDIVLERHACGDDLKRPYGSVPEIITLDPTLAWPGSSDDAWDPKYEYEEAIRSFVSQKSDRESMRIVQAAWGISTDIRKVSAPFCEQLDPQNHQFGFIQLRPTEACLDALPHTLEAILRSTGWLV